MKSKIIVSLVMAFGIFGLVSCHKALDLSPKDLISDRQMWQDQNLVVLYTNNFYAQLRSGFSNNNSITQGSWLLSSITDDAMAANSSSAARSTFAPQNFTASNSPLNSAVWNARYTFIRRANLYLANIDQVPGDQQLNKRLKAEVRFLRAYYYYDLVNFYGGVPLITTAQEIEDSLFLPRNTLTECYDFLVNELDTAANYLPTSYPASDAGRITKQAAWGLKCRVQMLKQDWAAAAASAKAIMDLNVNYLIRTSKTNPTSDDYTKNYGDIFATKNSAEMILSVQHNDRYDELGTQFDLKNFPPFYYGYGSNCPSQNLVDDYEMKTTGLAITAVGSGYSTAYPYVGRDPRFNATILHDSSVFKNRVMQMYTGGEDITTTGASNMNAAYITPTGYYLRKFTNDQFNPNGDVNARSSYNWPLIRYAEILLNYAEAKNEAAGPDASVFSAVDSVRLRAGMPIVPRGISQDSMRTIIRHERRIELAFEDFRYWDVKRWKQAVTLFSSTNTPIRKVTVARNPTTGAKSYTYATVTGYTRVFLDKHYLFPIPQTEIDMPGSKLIQN